VSLVPLLLLLQYVPGPGDDITVTDSQALGRGWRNTIFTMHPRVAPALPMPGSEAGSLAGNRPATLVAVASDVQDLQVRLGYGPCQIHAYM
jgi:hypothetical protein